MKINIAVWWVLDYENGERETLGGLERWTRDIVIELVRLGHEVTVYQKSRVEYSKSYYGAKIVGVPSSKNFSGNIIFYNKFKRLADPDCPTIFISQDLVWGADYKRSIAVNHGVWWSSRQSFFKKALLEYFNYRYISLTSRTICVDSNYINWVVESVPSGYKISQKLVFIPNYYDSRQFQYSTRERSGTIKVLFPRRIMGLNIHDEPRGGEDAIIAVANLIKEGFDLTLTMLGEGNLATDLRGLIRDLGVESRISFATAPFDQMHKFYMDHEVVLVPSRFSEGTSLSAIEGLASGCYVIGSCVGGLQNLPLFPPFGDMVEPNHTALQSSILKYINNRNSSFDRTEDVQQLVVGRFEFSNWKDRVINELSTIF